MVLFIAAVSALLVSGVLYWTSTDSHLTQRLNQFERSVVAASAATEKVVAHIARDFQSGGEMAVSNNLSTYRGLVPTPTEVLAAAGAPDDGVWGNYEFTDPQQQINRTYVERVTDWRYTNLQTKLPGMTGYAARYRIIANARELGAGSSPVSAVQQEVQLASLPVFQFQILYGLDLEINPLQSMAIPGRVHCNGTIYSQPAEALTFQNHVTASRKILNQKHPDDPVSRTLGTITYQGGHESGVNVLTLPIGTNRGPAALHALLEIPPASESRDSPLGRQRYYNKADMVILISNKVGVAKSGAYNNFSVTIPWTNIADYLVVKRRRISRWKWSYVTNYYDGVLDTNSTFFNIRENKTVQATEFDVSQLLTNYSKITSYLGRNPKTIYIADMRTQSASTQSGIRLISGDTLPSPGLTLVTPNPLYVQGDYNVPVSYLGTTNTSGSVPASLVGDAITILSDRWPDIDGTYKLQFRTATNTTINAALLGGIVPTRGGYYSGGVENFPRLLEDWTDYTLTLNGSMVALFESQIATAPWGANPDVYAPPVRQWAFDPNFLDPARLPPSTPELRTLFRVNWQTVAANSTP